MLVKYNAVYKAQLLALAIVSSGSANYCYAQEDDADNPELEAVFVYGEGYRTTGTKSDLTPIEAPMSYEIYDSELLRARQADSVNEALRYVPGITPESRSTVTIFDQYTIRGFESYRNYYDGLPLQYDGVWNLAPQVDAFATESIEVLKGPTSVLYGSAPPGGMINQTAKQPLPTAETLLRTRAGTSQLGEIGIDSTGPLLEGLNYRLIALYRQKDGQQVTTEEERRTLAPSVTWEITENTSLNLNVYYQDDPEMIPSTPLPSIGTLYSASYGKLGSDAYAGDENWGGFDRQVTMLGYKLNHAFNDNVTFLQNFRHTDGEARQENTYNRGLADNDRTLVRSAYFTDEEIEGFVVDNQLALNLDIGNTSHQLLFGIEYSTLESDIQYGDTLGTDTPTIDLANPNYNLINRATLPVNYYTETHDIEQTQLGFYLQDEFKWDALTVIAGVRRDRYDSTDDATTSFAGSPSASKTEIDQNETSLRAAAIYTFQNGWAPYISYAESFEPTSGVDSNTGAPFKPTTADQIEVGLKFKTRDGRTQFTAAYFDLTKQNVVVRTADFLSTTQNGEVESKGFELSVRSFITDNLEILANYTDLDVSITENPLNPALVGKSPVWVADRQASLWMNYFFDFDLELSGGIRHIGKSQIDAENTDTVPSYTVLDLAASYTFNDRFRLGLTVSNLTDKEYVGACFDRNNCWMGAERSVELNLYTTF